MVLSSISPLFILWGIRGSNLIRDAYFIPMCVALVVVPNAFLWWRIKVAVANRERRELVVDTHEDHRDHLLVYLFAMVLPFYADSLATSRTLASAFAALAFIVFLFWHLNMHYMNLAFALCGYRVFTLNPVSDGNPLNGRDSLVLITPRGTLSHGERINAYRISDTVYFEDKQ